MTASEETIREAAECAAPECERASRVGEWCEPHYRRLSKWGNLRLDVPIKSGMTEEQRFWSRVDRSSETGCWLWVGKSVCFRGYGKFYVGKRAIRAHRYSWELVNGAIPGGLWVLHRCDNPPCVRPDQVGLPGQMRRELIAHRAIHTTPRTPMLTALESATAAHVRTIGARCDAKEVPDDH